MKATLESILLNQSPALFFLALTFLVCYFVMRKRHKIRAALDLLLTIICLGGGIALYYFGMLYEHFTIHDFWKIRLPGWIGLGIAAAIVVVLSYRSAVKLIRKHRAEKLAAKKESDHAKELEDAKNAAYEAGKADAIAAEKVVDTVAVAVEAPASEAEAPVEEAPAVEAEKEPAEAK